MWSKANWRKHEGSSKEVLPSQKFGSVSVHFLTFLTRSIQKQVKQITSLNRTDLSCLYQMYGAVKNHMFTTKRSNQSLLAWAFFEKEHKLALGTTAQSFQELSFIKKNETSACFSFIYFFGKLYASVVYWLELKSLSHLGEYISFLLKLHGVAYTCLKNLIWTCCTFACPWCCICKVP